MTETMPVPTAGQDPTTRTAATRRVGLALAMLVAPWFIVIAETGHAVVTRNITGDDLDPAVSLAMTAEHVTLTRWLSLAAMLGAIALVPAVVGVMRLVRTEAARLGLVAGVLTAAGYICYFALVFQGAFTEVAMVTTGGFTSRDVAVLTAFMNDPLGAMWVGPVFVLGNVVGTFLLGLALVRARSAGRVAGYGLMAWSVLHIIGFPFAEALGATAQAVGFALAARALLVEGRSARTGPEAYELVPR